MIKKISRHNLRQKRVKRIKKKIKGTPLIPRLSIKKSLKNLYAQIVDDTEGRTLVSVSSINLKIDDVTTNCKKNKKVAETLGKIIAEKAREKGLKKVVFDRSGYLYHGKVKCFADAVRSEGLQF